MRPRNLTAHTPTPENTSSNTHQTTVVQRAEKGILNFLNKFRQLFTRREENSQPPVIPPHMKPTKFLARGMTIEIPRWRAEFHYKYALKKLEDYGFSFCEEDVDRLLMCDDHILCGKLIVLEKLTRVPVPGRNHIYVNRKRSDMIKILKDNVSILVKIFNTVGIVNINGNPYTVEGINAQLTSLTTSAEDPE